MNWTNKLLTHLRIANDEYPASEARYLSIEDWFNHETYVKEQLNTTEEKDLIKICEAAGVTVLCTKWRDDGVAVVTLGSLRRIIELASNNVRDRFLP